MIHSLPDLLSLVLLSAGSFFIVVGSIGLIRMPDLFTRMHATSIIDTLGAGLLIAGMMIQAGFTLVSVKLAILLILFFFTSPVATHALAQAALHDGVDPLLDAEDAGRSKLDENKKD